MGVGQEGKRRLFSPLKGVRERSSEGAERRLRKCFGGVCFFSLSALPRPPPSERSEPLPAATKKTTSTMWPPTAGSTRPSVSPTPCSVPLPSSRTMFCTTRWLVQPGTLTALDKTEAVRPAGSVSATTATSSALAWWPLPARPGTTPIPCARTPAATSPTSTTTPSTPGSSPRSQPPWSQPPSPRPPSAARREPTVSGAGNWTKAPYLPPPPPGTPPRPSQWSGDGHIGRRLADAGHRRSGGDSERVRVRDDHHEQPAWVLQVGRLQGEH